MTKVQATVEANKRDFVAEFKAQKSLPKKEIYKLKPGTWVELRYRDAPNAPALLLSKAEQCPGDSSVHVLSMSGPVPMPTWLVHSQIVRNLGPVQVPACGG